MKSQKILAICDPEEAYAIHLADYLNARDLTPFRALAFSNADSLIHYAKEHQIEILLLAPEMTGRELRELPVRKTIFLSDGTGQERAFTGDAAAEPSVCKYQSSDCLAREMMSLYNGPDSASDPINAVLIGVFSPISRCGKTLFSLTLGQILGRKKKTLYLNLEHYSGFEALLARSFRHDLPDLLYLAEKERRLEQSSAVSRLPYTIAAGKSAAGQGEMAEDPDAEVLSLPVKLACATETIGNLDFLPPAFFPSDLHDVTAAEWISFLRKALACGSYETVILDIGPDLQDVPSLLRFCTHLYMPLLTDPVSKAKISQFEKNLESLGMSAIMEKTVRLYLPLVALSGEDPDMLEHLTEGKMGTFVRHLLQGGKSCASG